jgi:hypothetical protein
MPQSSAERGPESGPYRPEGFVLTDAHVHVHGCFDSGLFLDAALRNFRRGAEALGLGGPLAFCLLLSEMKGVSFFQRFRDGGTDVRDGGWTFEPTAERESLTARRRGTDDRLTLIAGRQVATREGLEVLALCTAEEIPDGLSLSDTLDRVRAAGALPVLPWGFGKWWLSRGKRVARELPASPENTELYLGDNAGRPAAAFPSRLLRAAEERGIPVLPGSDPLPLETHADRAGSYGFLLSGKLDPDRPAQSLARRVRRVRAAGGRLRPFGRRSGLLQFCRDQAALRAASRRGRRGSPQGVTR